VLEERNFPDKIELELPKGKIGIYNSLNMPISHKDEEIGRILVLNKPGDFNQLDKNLLTAIVSYIAPLLYDKLTIKKMKQNQQQLKAVISKSKIKVKEAIEIDEIDEQILTGLYKDGNITLQDLSKTVIKPNGESMSGTGVKKRIKKLKKRNILKVQGNVNLEKLDYKLVYYLVNLKDYGDIDKIQELKNNCLRLFLLSQIMGKYHLLLGFYGRDIEEVCKSINNCGILNEVIDKKNSDLFRILNLGLPTFYPVKVVGGRGTCENCRFYKKQNS
jgi:DNA-binding Lrp family transcriptional regulator